MDYLENILFLCVIGINIIALLVFCVLEYTNKKIQRKRTKKHIIYLSIFLVLNVICAICFIIKGHIKDAEALILFFALLGYFLYEDIGEIRKCR